MIKLVDGVKLIKDLCNKIKSYPPLEYLPERLSL